MIRAVLERHLVSAQGKCIVKQHVKPQPQERIVVFKDATNLQRRTIKLLSHKKVNTRQLNFINLYKERNLPPVPTFISLLIALGFIPDLLV